MCALCARLRDSPLLGQIREALVYGEQYYGSTMAKSAYNDLYDIKIGAISQEKNLIYNLGLKLASLSIKLKDFDLLVL